MADFSGRFKGEPPEVDLAPPTSIDLGALTNVDPLGQPLGFPNVTPNETFTPQFSPPTFQNFAPPALLGKPAVPNDFSKEVISPPVPQPFFTPEMQHPNMLQQLQPQPIDYTVPSYFDQAIPDLSYTSPMFNNPIAPTPAVPIAPATPNGIPQGWTQSPIGPNPYGLPEDTPMFSPPPVSMPDMGPPTNVQPQQPDKAPLGPPMSQLTTPQTLTAFQAQPLPQPPIQFQPPLSFPQKDQDPYQIDQMDLVPAPFPDFNIVNPMFESLAPHATPEFQDISVPSFNAPQSMEQAMNSPDAPDQGSPDQGSPDDGNEGGGGGSVGPSGSTASGTPGGQAVGGGAASTGEEGGGGGGGEGGGSQGAAASSSTGNPGGMATGGGATSDGGEGGATGGGPGPGDAGSDGAGTGV